MNEPWSLPEPEAAPGPGAGAPPHRRLDRRGALGLAGLGALAAAAGVTYRLVEDSSKPAPDADHVLRRTGFAPAPAELAAAVAAGGPRTIDVALHPEKVDDSALEATLSAGTFDFTRIPDVRRWWLTRMALTKRPLVEKMTLFWHGLLTSSYRKAGRGDLMYVQNQLLRTHALGSLKDLFTGISQDGAMLRWLDGTGSNKLDPNENYAREFMELFTMGVGNYTEEDVRAGARALTGFAVTKAGQVVYRPRAHDDGMKTFLGRTGNFGLTDVVDIVLAHPATPRHIAGKMWEFFVYPGPSESDLAPVIDAFHTTQGSIRAMMAAILTSPAFSSPKAYRALVKSPTELIAGLHRQFSLPVDAAAGELGETMGQGLFDPPNVAGWPGDGAWISTGSWMARMRYLLYRAHQPATGRLVAAAVEPAGTTPAGILDALLGLMVDNNVSPDARSAIAGHLVPAGGSAVPETTAAELMFLVAATPEYQLA